jgi:hypothetical protein
MIIFTALTGLWFIWKRHKIQLEHDLFIEIAQGQLKAYRTKLKVETEFIRKEYEEAQRGYLKMMKEMKSDEIPPPSDIDYFPK